jgi:serine/threonine protein kinase/tetratricopeptide (TPR) repeat protein
MALVTQILVQRYQLEHIVGTGGMGSVYRGLDLHTNEHVAVKLLKPEIVQRDPDMLVRFAREALLLKELNHPSIVKVLATVEQDDAHYIVMEYIPGGTLQEALKRNGQMSVQQTLDVALDIADALTRAHRLKIIHRDIKPANILIAHDGTPRLTDFGIAFTEKLERLTPTDHGIGTPDYMSPESALGQTVDARSDIWSLGVVLFEMLTAQRPFKGDNLAQVIASIMTRNPPDLELLRPDVPLALVDLIYRMLEKEPAARLASVRQVGAELEAIAAGRADSSRRFHTPPPTPTDASHSHLPAQTTHFVGRERELAAIQGLLHETDTRMVTLLAPGGMGKTRLAIEIAHQMQPEFPGGVYFVPLAAVPLASNIMQRIADVLGFPLQSNSLSPSQQIADYLHERRILLVLDNFDHLLDGANLILELLEGAPHLNILVTSRERLNLSSETIFDLDGMDFPQYASLDDVQQFSSVVLFTQSARRVQPGFNVNVDNYRHIAHICRMVQGMPLAIVLAAAWVETLSLEEIERELKTSPDFLDTDMRDIPERHRSIRAVFDYSWKVLNDDERNIFMRLALFRGGFTRQAAQSVTGASLRVLTTLVSKSLLRRVVATGRYEIHEMLRQYARQQLEASGKAEEAQRTFYRYFNTLLYEAEADIKGKDQRNVMERIAPDTENIRSAWQLTVQFGDYSAFGQTFELARWYIIFRSRYQGGLELLRAALTGLATVTDADGIYTRQRLRVRYIFVERWRNGSYMYQEDAAWQIAATLALAQSRQDDSETAACLFMQGDFAYTQRQYETAIPLFEQALALYDLLKDDYYRAWCFHFLGLCKGFLGQLDEATHAQMTSLQLRRGIGDKMGCSFALQNLGLQALFQGAVDESEAYFREYVAITEEMEDVSAQAMSALPLGLPPLLRGDLPAARQPAEQALNKALELNHLMGKSYALAVLGVVNVLDKDLLVGQLMSRESLSITPKPDVRFLADWGMALANCGLQDFVTAARYYEAMRQFAERSQSSTALVVSLAVGAVLLADAGETSQAIELLAFVETQPASLTGWTQQWSEWVALRGTLAVAPDYSEAYARGKELNMAVLL